MIIKILQPKIILLFALLACEYVYVSVYYIYIF